MIHAPTTLRHIDSHLEEVAFTTAVINMMASATKPVLPFMGVLLEFPADCSRKARPLLRT